MKTMLPAVAILGLLALNCNSLPAPPLVIAATAGDLDRVTSLLRDGANPNAADLHGFTPLIYAAREGRIDVIPILIERGADPNLRGGISNWPPLIHAIHKNQLKAVEALLNHGAAVNASGPHHESALMTAAGYGQADMVRLLLCRGADPRAKGVHGETALSLAISGVPDIDCLTIGRCQTETVKILLDAAPDMAVAVNSWARTIARLGGCTEVLRLLEGRATAISRRN